MQQRISEKDTEILKYKNEIKKERIDNSIMAVASKNNAINPSQVVSLLKDAIKLNIRIVAIVDTNSDPTVINFPIPGNDDARRSINLY